jgi:hypothetical protein
VVAKRAGEVGIDRREAEGERPARDERLVASCDNWYWWGGHLECAHGVAPLADRGELLKLRAAEVEGLSDEATHLARAYAPSCALCGAQGDRLACARECNVGEPPFFAQCLLVERARRIGRTRIARQDVVGAAKFSGERIKDCITALKAFDLQGVFSMSTGNIPYAFEHCDWLVVVSKNDRRVGKRTEISNVPVSLARNSEDARRLMGS